MSPGQEIVPELIEVETDRRLLDCLGNTPCPRLELGIRSKKITAINGGEKTDGKKRPRSRRKKRLLQNPIDRVLLAADGVGFAALED